MEAAWSQKINNDIRIVVYTIVHFVSLRDLLICALKFKPYLSGRKFSDFTPNYGRHDVDRLGSMYMYIHCI